MAGTMQDAINLVQWCSEAGFTGQSLTTFVSLGLSESGGNPNAVNQNAATGDDSWGLFQINYYGGLAQSRTSQFGPKQGLLDPFKNASAAYVLS
jgi:SLT domain-containing protein